jgi:T-complex protein 1 subunit gamma
MVVIILSNDGHAILREIELTHPSAISILEISRAQEEEVGDVTTSVIILTGKMMAVARIFIERDIHPTVKCSSYYQALQEGLKIMKDIYDF